MNQNTNIIGLAGTFASGKDTLAHYLVQHYNYLHVSTSDMVRQEALKERGSIERPVLHEVANNLRHTHGAGVMVELAIKLFEAKLAEREDYKGLVVSGLRSLGEAKAIKEAGGTLVFTDAPIEIRYERMVSRQRDAETKLTLDEFKAQEAKELETAGDSDESFNILGIRDMSDVVLGNDTDLEGYLQNAVQALHLDTK